MAVRGGATGGGDAWIVSAAADVEAISGFEFLWDDGLDRAAPAGEPVLGKAGAVAPSGAGMCSGSLTGGTSADGELDGGASGAEEAPELSSAGGAGFDGVVAA